MNTTEIQRIKQRYNIVGNHDGLNRALDVALQVAPTDLSVLIVGESGVGKEIVPRIIHDNSPRRREKYFAINCGSIPEGTIDSELFGHEKGSFTGAIGESEGYFGIANKGTIFLDEVGELPLATQARLLRVLETGEYIRVGGTEIRKTDVRIVAATNVNMRKAISEGRFREDLFYRLNTIPIQMPSLRERGQDIILLFRLFAMQMAEKYHLPKITLTEDAKALMLHYKWPGNVRELKNLTEQMSVLSEQREIDVETLRRFIPQDPESTQLAVITKDGNHSYENEREMVFKILYEMKGSVSELRRELNTVRRQIEEVRDLNGAAGFSPQITTAPTERIHPPTTSPLPVDLTHLPQQETSAVEEAIAEEINEPESLNLSNIGRQMVEKALERNNGNRKKAAKELGISDRTLYRRLKQYGLGMLLTLLLLTSCSVSYKFNGASIDYNKTKTIQIADFPNRSAYVWGPMAAMFNNQLKDVFASHTRLQQVRRNGDLKIEGEITQYQQRNKSVSSEGYSAQVELSMTVNVRFTNTKNQAEDFERQFSAAQTYDSNLSLNSVQEEIVRQMIEDITDQIFNATVANW
jgi:DNA-binding NtrC family response regulator